VTTDSVTAVGSVQSRRKTDVASQLLATIREITPRPGDRVKANDVLIVLDDRDLLAQQREAVAALATAEADLVTRTGDLRRMKAIPAGSVSADEIAKVEGAYKVADAQVKRLKEAIGRIEVLLTYTKISLKTDGVVAERLAEPGDLATPGKPLLTVYDPNDLELHVNVPESLAVGVAIGAEFEYRIDALGLQGKTKVREIVPQAQQASRSVLVKLALPLQSGVTVLSGLYGRAEIPVSRRERILVPELAVQQVGQLDLVELVLPDNTLSRQYVRVGRSTNGKVEILSGLAAGDRIALPAK
jgi:RND family efflux transporter MFP subunit